MKFIVFLAAVLSVWLAWLISFRRQIRQKGFDPSLITFADPLSWRTYSGYRVALGLLFAVSVIAPLSWLALILATIVITSAVSHISLIYLFGRQHTQPANYYILAVVAASVLLSRSKWELMFFLAVVATQETLLWQWQKTSQARYDDWVERLTRHLTSRYVDLADSMPLSAWRWVAHVAVTESIARPAFVRWAERLYFKIKRPAYISTGIMQIRANRPLSDAESMLFGAKIIRQILPQMPKNLNHQQQMHWLAKHYNGSGSYAKYLSATAKGVKQAFNN
jgi:hypothetical protein